MDVFNNEQIISVERQFQIEPWLRVLIPAIEKKYGIGEHFNWDPISIKKEIFPFNSEIDIESLLEAALYSGAIIREDKSGITFGVLPSTKKGKSSKVSLSLINEIFNHWKATLGHPRSKLDAKRKKIISDALKLGYESCELKDAISGCASTPFNMGENDRGEVYDGLNIIFRDGSQIDRFIRNFRSPPGSKINTKKHNEILEWATNAKLRYQ